MVKKVSFFSILFSLDACVVVQRTSKTDTEEKILLNQVVIFVSFHTESILLAS